MFDKLGNSDEDWSTITGMHDQNEVLRSYFFQKDRSRGDDPEAVELAYWLQNSTPNDPAVLERLVYRYANELYPWVEILMFYQRMVKPSQAEILSRLKRIFGTAIKDVEQFHGKESASDWLFSIAYQVVRGSKSINESKINHPGRDKTSSLQDALDGSEIDLEKIPERVRSTLVLRYRYELELDDIATILAKARKDVHQRLIKGRKQLVAHPGRSHSEKKIQAFVDGFLDDDPNELESLNQHLSGCDICLQSLQKIDGLEKDLVETLQKRWVSPRLSTEILNSLIQSVINEIVIPKAGRTVKFPLRQTAWIIGLALLMVGFVIISLRLTPAEKSIATPEISSSFQLPPIIEMQPADAVKPGVNNSPSPPQYIAPAFSSDGKWAVFSAIKFRINSEASILQTIDLYNREANTIHVISENLAFVNSWVWWDLAPGISGDGRWIVYVGNAERAEIGGASCETADQRDCLDIFLYDRFTGITKRITQAAKGGAADGDSMAPTISADGQWVAFWSTADNLVEGFNNTCEQNGITINCLYIYLYNLASGKVSWIPIRTIPGDYVYGVDRISLSADARYVGFTVSSSSEAGSPALSYPLTSFNSQNEANGNTISNSYIPVIAHSSEAIVYDRETGKYELENQNHTGVPGDGSSSSPVISADGRYVAFVSASANLVEGDNNNSSDVFVRDRESGKVELISVSSSGQQGSSDSGYIYSARGYYSLNISDDGNYVVFESAVGNLGTNGNQGCNLNDNRECHFLYVHDRKIGSTELISGLTNPDFTLFPGITSDGRWVSYMQFFNRCSLNQPFCSNVMLYDRQNHWTTDLTKFDQEIPVLPWAYSGSISPPWESWENPALALSPDGILIALGGNDSKVRIWQSADVSNAPLQNKAVKTFQIEGNDSFSSLVFSSNGEWLAGGTNSGAVYIWNMYDGKIIHSIHNQPELVRQLVFSQDSSQLIISTLHTAWTWRLDDNQMYPVDGFSPVQSEANAIDISPKGNIIASARGDGTVWLQSLLSREVIARLGTNQVSASSLAFSIDGSLLAAALSDGSITIWHIDENGVETSSITFGKTYKTNLYIGELAFSSDNNYLASSGAEGEVTVWSIPEGKAYTVATPLPDGMVFSLAFSQRGDRLAALFENEIVLWKIPTENPSTFYVHAQADSLVDTNPNVETTSTGFPFPQSIYNDISAGNLVLEQTAKSVAFQLIVPAHIPEGMSFYAANVNADGSVWLRYDVFAQQAYRASLYIYEKSMGDNSLPSLTVGAGADIIQTQVATLSGAVPAEYVQGDWSAAPSFTLPPGNSASAEIHNTWYWDNGSIAQRLRWQQNNVFIAFYYQPRIPYSEIIGAQGSNPEWVYLNTDFGQADLLQIAAGMLPYSEMSPVSSADAPAGVTSLPKRSIPRINTDILSTAVPNFTAGNKYMGMNALK